MPSHRCANTAARSFKRSTKSARTASAQSSSIAKATASRCTRRRREQSRSSCRNVLAEQLVSELTQLRRRVKVDHSKTFDELQSIRARPAKTFEFGPIAEA